MACNFHGESDFGSDDDAEQPKLCRHTQLALWEQMPNGTFQAFFPALLLTYGPKGSLDAHIFAHGLKPDQCTLALNVALDNSDGPGTVYVPVKTLASHQQQTPIKVAQSIVRLEIVVPQQSLLAAGDSLLSATRVERKRGVWVGGRAKGADGQTTAIIECQLGCDTTLQFQQPGRVIELHGNGLRPMAPYIRLLGRAQTETETEKHGMQQMRCLSETGSGPRATITVDAGVAARDTVDVVWLKNDTMVMQPLVLPYEPARDTSGSDFNSIPYIPKLRDACRVVRYVAKCPTAGHRVVAVCKTPFIRSNGEGENGPDGYHHARLELGPAFASTHGTLYDGAVCFNYSSGACTWTEFNGCSAVELLHQPGCDMEGVVIMARPREAIEPNPNRGRQIRGRSGPLDAAVTHTATPPPRDRSPEKTQAQEEDEKHGKNRRDDKDKDGKRPRIGLSGAELLSRLSWGDRMHQLTPNGQKIKAPTTHPTPAAGPNLNPNQLLVEALHQCANALAAAYERQPQQ